MTRFKKKTVIEIVEQWKFINKTDRDIYGFECMDLLEFLTIKECESHLPGTVNLDIVWEAKEADQRTTIGLIVGYMKFAWGKANNCRGLSAGRSLAHMSAWLWLLGLDDKIEGLHEHTMYGKPQLVAICELPEINIDWRVMDNGRWSNSEEGIGQTANEVLGR